MIRSWRATVHQSYVYHSQSSFFKVFQVWTKVERNDGQRLAQLQRLPRSRAAADARPKLSYITNHYETYKEACRAAKYIGLGLIEVTQAVSGDYACHPACDGHFSSLHHTSFSQQNNHSFQNFPFSESSSHIPDFITSPRSYSSLSPSRTWLPTTRSSTILNRSRTSSSH